MTTLPNLNAKDLLGLEQSSKGAKWVSRIGRLKPQVGL